MITQRCAKFAIGQVVHHKLFDYRGVVADVDPCFLGSEEWYDQMARTRPPKDAPWYRVLVHGRNMETYVAERNLEADARQEPVDHPLIDLLFERLSNGGYAVRGRMQ